MPYSFLFWYIVLYHETVTGKLISLIFSDSPVLLLHGEEIFLKVDYKFYFPRTWYCLVRAVWKAGYISFLMLLQQIITTSMLIDLRTWYYPRRLLLETLKKNMLSFALARVYLHSLTYDPFFYLQCQQQSIFSFLFLSQFYSCYFTFSAFDSLASFS